MTLLFARPAFAADGVLFAGEYTWSSSVSANKIKVDDTISRLQQEKIITFQIEALVEDAWQIGAYQDHQAFSFQKDGVCFITIRGNPMSTYPNSLATVTLHEVGHCLADLQTMNDHQLAVKKINPQGFNESFADAFTEHTLSVWGLPIAHLMKYRQENTNDCNTDPHRISALRPASDPSLLPMDDVIVQSMAAVQRCADQPVSSQ